MHFYKYRIFALMAVLMWVGSQIQAQNNEAIKIEDKLPVSSGEKTDITFTRALLIGSADGAPFENARSGVYSVGIGYGIPIGGKVLELKIEPRATWHKLYFEQDTARWFPMRGIDTSVTRVYEKMRAFYIEMPVGLKFKLARNAEDKYKLLIEAGFSIGFNTGSTSKIRNEHDSDGDGTLDTKQTIKTHSVPDVNRWRYGPYFRFGTNWGSLYGFYRMSELFDPNATFNSEGTERSYPAFPQIEIGLSITL